MGLPRGGGYDTLCRWGAAAQIEIDTVLHASECDELFKARKQLTDLAAKKAALVEAQRLAQAAGKAADFATYTQQISDIDSKFVRLTRLVGAIGRAYLEEHWRPNRPGDARFFLGQSYGPTRTTPVAIASLHVAATGSSVPVTVGSPVGLETDVARRPFFASDAAPKWPDNQAVPSIVFYPPSDEHGVSCAASSPRIAEMFNDPSKFKPRTCDILSSFEVSARLSLADYCVEPVNGISKVVDAKVDFKMPGTSNEDIVLVFHFGPKVGLQEGSDLAQQRIVDTNAAADSYVKEFLLDVLGEAQAYRVSDDALGSFVEEESKIPVLRTALRSLVDDLFARDDLITDNQLNAFFTLASPRYSFDDTGVMTFSYKTRKGSVVLLRFVKVASRTFVRQVVLDSKVYATLAQEPVLQPEPNCTELSCLPRKDVLKLDRVLSH